MGKYMSILFNYSIQFNRNLKILRHYHLLTFGSFDQSSSYITSPSMSESAHGASRSSCHKMPSSVPSSSLVIEHFLNALMMIAGSIESQAVLTHCVTIGSGGRFMLLAAVCSAVPDIIHVDHSLRSLQMKGWFTEPWSGCKTEVRPPGMTAILVLWHLLVCCLTLSTRYARNRSQTSRLFLFTIPPSHAFCNQINIMSVSIQPFWYKWMMTPYGDLWALFFF